MSVGSNDSPYGPTTRCAKSLEQGECEPCPCKIRRATAARSQGGVPAVWVSIVRQSLEPREYSWARAEHLEICEVRSKFGQEE